MRKSTSGLPEQGLVRLVEATEQMRHGDYSLESFAGQAQNTGAMWQALQKLADALKAEVSLQHRLDQITVRINAGLTLEEILNKVYDEFHDLIPYSRIGFSLINENDYTAVAYWARSDHRSPQLTKGYSASLAGSSLERVLVTGQPRIIDDLEAYLQQKPESESTRLIVEEGLRSSLTCPLVVENKPVGFIFFSSDIPQAYDEKHVVIFQRIAAQLSVIVEKGRLVSELTERKHEIEEKNAELVRLNELKNAFVGIAAHDMRNPLGSILLAITFLLETRGELSSEQRTMIMQDVQSQAQHMANLIDDLLDVTQIEAGKLELRCELFEVPPFLDDAVRRHNRLAESKGTRVITTQVDDGRIYADCHRLRQVIDNLISNAVKYAPAGSTVEVGAVHEAKGWHISISDEGPGIQPDERERLFKAFARLSAQPTGDEKSTGLGLAISHRVVEEHGGVLDVDSAPGEGATFWFTIPDRL